MPTLELLIDASGMRTGAAQAESALRSVTTQAERTATTVRSVGPSLSGAFQIGGGSVQIAQGIAQTAQAFGQLNTQAALFSSARTLLEVGNTVRDFQQFRGAVGGVTSVFGALGLAIRANPIGIIATVIGVAATAMGLFGSKTEEATSQVKTQVSELEKLKQGLEGASIRANFGVGDDPRLSAQGASNATEAFARSTSPVSIADIARTLNISEQDVRYGLARRGFGDSILEGQTERTPIRSRDPNRPFDVTGYREGPFRFNVGAIQGTQAAGFAADVFRERDAANRRGAASYQFGAGGVPSNELGPVGAAMFEAGAINAGGGARDYVSQSLGDRAQVEREAQINAAARIAESMERAAQFGEQIGASVGDAAAQMLFAGRTFRDVLGNIVRQFATQGLQNAGAGLFRAAVTGITATQAQGNQGVDPGQLAPNE